jgi:hypothetical protein
MQDEIARLWLAITVEDVAGWMDREPTKISGIVVYELPDPKGGLQCRFLRLQGGAFKLRDRVDPTGVALGFSDGPVQRVGL